MRGWKIHTFHDLPLRHQDEARKQLSVPLTRNALYADDARRRAISDSVIGPSKPARRLRQDTKPLLNKLENEFFEYIKDEYISATIRPQAIRFRLANGLWYKPDFTMIAEDLCQAWEVKGPHAFRGGFENLKMAASTYPEWNWVLVWKENGCWKEQKVLP